MRMVCGPSFWNHTSPVSFSQYACRDQPQLVVWQSPHVQRFSVKELVVPMR